MGSVFVDFDTGLSVEFGIAIAGDVGALINYQNAGTQIVGDSLSNDTAKKACAHNKIIVFRCHILNV